jgi:2-polyprenyl-3-methyl-5-hydroxy-6-metoxy-1,4-benzoquinol methylase
MGTPVEAKRSAKAAYNATSDFYGHPVNTFWERYGQQTVSRLQLGAGARVLDVCCGAGASAIPAARVVGPNGFVLGVDLAENLIELAKSKAGELQLDNIEFRVADMLDLDPAPSAFDVVVCVFGIFFVPDMQQAIRELWKLLRPAGQFAITTWGPRFFEPASTAFWSAVRNERPDLYRGFNPWDRISEPETLRELLLPTGATAVDITPETSRHHLHSPEDWWPMVLGTGYRGTIEQLDPAQRERVKKYCVEYIRANCMGSVEANVLYGVATKSRVSVA